MPAGGAGVPGTMRVSVLRGVGDVAVEERPVPRPADDEVLVSIGSVGVCGSDVHYFRHGRIGEYVVRQPLVLGHEAGGVVVAVGAAVSPDRLGERVAVEPGIPCRRCRECREGHYNLCRDVRFFATPPVDGAFAGYVTVPADFAHPVPDNLSDDAAGLVEPLAVAVWACRRAAVGLGSRVLVAGAGPVGLLTAAVARAAGAMEVVVSDVQPERLEAATAAGATRVLDARTEAPADVGVEVDSFVDCSGAQAAVSSGVRAVRPAGDVVLVGMGADDIVLPLGLLQGNELRVTGGFRYAHAYPTAIALAASGLVDLDALVTATFGLDDVAAALETSEDPRSTKVVVRPHA